jgi:hypothetical protein
VYVWSIAALKQSTTTTTNTGTPTGVITKRHLGFLFLVIGVLGFIGVFAIDIIRGRQGDFGPSQQFALVGCAGLVVLGLSLIPLGDRPA